MKKFIVFLYILWLVPCCTFASTMEGELQALKDQVKVLLERIDTLEKKQKEQATQGRPSPLVVPATSELPKPLEPPVIRSGEKNIRVALSGQVNRMLLYGDNKHNSRLLHVDNNTDSSRLRVVGEGDFNKDLTLQTTIEGEFLSSSSAAVDITNAPAPGTSIGWTSRVLEFSLQSKTFGSLFVGRGPTASSDTSESDLSKTDAIAVGGDAELMAGGFSFVDTHGNKGPTVIQVYSSMDGLVRTDRVRYDTPSFHGFFLGMAHGGGDQSDISLKFAGDYHKTQMTGAISFANARPQHLRQSNGSASILFPIGISLTAAAGQQVFDDISRSKAYFGLGKIGYQHQWFELGITAFAVDYGRAWNITQNKDKSQVFGIFLVQQVEKFGTDFYFGLRNYHLNRPNENFPDILAIALGARVKF